MGSALWGSEDRLFAILQAADLGDETQVSLGVPDNIERDNVWIDEETDEWETTYEVSGFANRNERFGVQIVVVCIRGGATYKEVRDATAELVAKVEDALLADVQLGGTVMSCTIGRYKKASALVDANARGVRVTITAYVNAWIA